MSVHDLEEFTGADGEKVVRGDLCATSFTDSWRAERIVEVHGETHVHLRRGDVSRVAPAAEVYRFPPRS